MSEESTPGYAIAQLSEIDLGPAIIEYIERIEGTFAPFGGEWLVHGTSPEVLEGGLDGDIVMIRFPSVQAARRWYRSPAYQEIAPLRTRHSRAVVALLAGVPQGYAASSTAAHLRGLLETQH